MTDAAVEEKKGSDGKVVAVQGPVVDIKFERVEDMPDMHETIMTKTFDKRDIMLLVAEHLEGNIARCVSLSATLNLQRNAPAPGGTTMRYPQAAAKAANPPANYDPIWAERGDPNSYPRTPTGAGLGRSGPRTGQGDPLAFQRALTSQGYRMLGDPRVAAPLLTGRGTSSPSRSGLIHYQRRRDLMGRPVAFRRDPPLPGERTFSPNRTRSRFRGAPTDRQPLTPPRGP